MAVTLVGASIADTGASTSLSTYTITNPSWTGSATPAGHLVLLYSALRGASTFTTPAGFTAVPSLSSASTVFQLFYRVTDGTEGSTFTVAYSATGVCTSVCISYSGADLVLVMDPAVPATSGAAGTGTLPAAGITTGRDGDQLVWFGASKCALAADVPGTITPPAGFTGRVTQQSTTAAATPNMTSLVADAAQGTRGATGTETGTTTNATEHDGALVVALAAALVAPAPGPRIAPAWYPGLPGMPGGTPFAPWPPPPPAPAPPVVTLTNNFEGVTPSGTTLTQGAGGNTGGVSGNFVDSVSIGTSATLVSDSARAVHGSLSCQVATAATSTTSYAAWTASLGTVSQTWFRAYLYFTANPPANVQIIRFQQAGTLCASLRIGTTGTLAFLDSASGTIFTTTAAVALNQWVRVEGFVAASATTGQVELKLFNTADSPTPTETDTSSTAQNTFGSITAVRYGITSSVASVGPFWIDDIGLSTAGYLGPAVAPPVLPAVRRAAVPAPRRLTRQQFVPAAAAPPPVSPLAPSSPPAGRLRRGPPRSRPAPAPGRAAAAPAAPARNPARITVRQQRRAQPVPQQVGTGGQPQQQSQVQPFRAHLWRQLRSARPAYPAPPQVGTGGQPQQRSQVQPFRPHLWRLLRSGIAAPVPPQVTAQVAPLAPPATRPRRLLLPRRAGAAQPVPAQRPAPAQPRVPRIRWPRRLARPSQPVPQQVGTGGQPIPAVGPPFRQARLWRPLRSRIAQPAPPQVGTGGGPQTRNAPPPFRPHLWRQLRSARPAYPAPPQVGTGGQPSPVQPPARKRLVWWRLPRKSFVVPAPTNTPGTAQPAPTGSRATVLRMGWLRTRRTYAPPPQQAAAAPPTVTPAPARRPPMPPRRPLRAGQPVPGLPPAPAPARPRRAAWVPRSRRPAQPVPAAAPVPAPAAPRVRRLILPRRPRSSPPRVPAQVPPPPVPPRGPRWRPWLGWIKRFRRPDAVPSAGVPPPPAHGLGDPGAGIVASGLTGSATASAGDPAAQAGTGGTTGAGGTGAGDPGTGAGASGTMGGSP